MSDDLNQDGSQPSSPSAGYESVEDIFRQVALMRPAPPKDEDPYQSEEYQKFVESMVEHCRCTPEGNRPCDGVLAGGLCDDLHWERDHSHEDEDS